MLYVWIGIGLLLALILSYFIYVCLSYHRIDDRVELIVSRSAKKKTVPVERDLTIMSYNIGFGAYTADYSFFMDGGKESRARSKESLKRNLFYLSKVISSVEKDFCLLQEVDDCSTRSYHVNEREFLLDQLSHAACDSTFAVNYDSPYLLYPVHRPHGKSHSGLLSLSQYSILTATRRSLPIQKGLPKLMDLDRCYSVQKIPTTDGKFLCLYHFHLSAYTTDPELSNRQLDMIYEDMLNERARGNYVIAGGDFNKDLLENSNNYFVSDGKKHSGVTAFPYRRMPNSLHVVFPYDEKLRIPTCRNAHEPYIKGKTYVQTIDGFLLTDNVKEVSVQVMDTGFQYSDHNPVVMTFQLNPQP